MKENYKKPFNRLKYAERSLIAINTNLQTYPVALVVTYIYVCVALLQHSILISAMSSKMAMSSSTRTLSAVAERAQPCLQNVKGFTASRCDSNCEF